MTQTVLQNPECDSFDQFLDEFRQTLANAVGRLKEISEEAANEKDGPTSWSSKQIIGHLIDSAANNHQRFVRAHSSNNLVFDGYKQDEWVEVQRYDAAPWHELIDLWAAYNRHLIHVMASLPSETLTRVRTEHNLDQLAWKAVDKNEPTTLEYFVRDYFGHLQHHLTQISRLQERTT